MTTIEMTMIALVGFKILISSRKHKNNLYHNGDFTTWASPDRENPALKNPPGLRGRYILRSPLSA